jgi:ABC-type transport system involved in multi-copper enzyme maturation permease subunit
MFRRELAVVLRARVTWGSGAAAALLVGHGFVLAIDLFTAGARSVQGNALMAREFDPLLGIVRPTLGGLYLATSLFAPLIGARAIAVEKDRHTFHARLLAAGSAWRFVAVKALAALLGTLLPWLAALLLCLVWLAVGGHLALHETAVALLGHLLYAAFVTALGLAAGALARNFAQAATTAILAVAATWAIDAAEGFSALAWLGGAASWSPSTYLRPFELGTFEVAATAWFLAAALGGVGLAMLGCRFDLHGVPRGGRLGVAVAGMLLAMLACPKLRGAWDVSEAARHSLPPTAARELATLPGRLRLTVHLDREDSRRRQLENDTLAKLRLARPDLEIRYPPDERSAPAALDADAGYGRVVIALGDRSYETTSTSRREIVTLVFEAAGRALPDWTAPEYRGYPLVIEGSRRTAILAISYAGLPLAFVALGAVLTANRRRKRRTEP